MSIVRGTLSAVVGVTWMFGVVHAAPTGHTFPAKGESADAGTLPACMSWVQRAPYRNLGYDHEVEITNTCERAADCTVSTDVSPKPISVEVPAGATVTVLTYRGSPAYAFKASVSCRLRK